MLLFPATALAGYNHTGSLTLSDPTPVNGQTIQISYTVSGKVTSSEQTEVYIDCYWGTSRETLIYWKTEWPEEDELVAIGTATNYSGTLSWTIDLDNDNLFTRCHVNLFVNTIRDKGQRYDVLDHEEFSFR
jgi:TPP-dependent 2-oxoacid decarboxylase